jgi:hypothetical protein
MVALAGTAIWKTEKYREKAIEEKVAKEEILNSQIDEDSQSISDVIVNRNENGGDSE